MKLDLTGFDICLDLFEYYFYLMTTAAALSVKNPFSTPFVRSLDAYLSRLNWSKKSCSDLFALYYVYKVCPIE